ncbi:hypothetical protein HPB49_006937 [Dermacentor silvarum]|uniref:Uncharacterized protein n=1 Tax=Dermacentor silvarum TaxID=543639 RepID=A0ACB8CQJ8_DERSI|nr:hypothetical protein HPB49_006937 [Dermacentor silvarum]
MAEPTVPPADLAPQERSVVGTSPRSDESVFSAQGDRVIAQIPVRSREIEAATVADACIPAQSREVSRPPEPSSERGGVDVSLTESFHRAVDYQKQIIAILFESNCKVTNNHRSQILGLLRMLVQECADMRAVAARQCGRADELRGQLTQARLAGSIRCPPPPRARRS